MNWKRTFAIAAVVLGILSVIGIGVGRMFLDFWTWFEPIPQPLTPAIEEAIKTQGFSSEVVTSVRSFALPEQACFVWVAETTGGHLVVAAAPKELEGRSQEELLDMLRTGDRLCQAEWTTVKAPDGKEYDVGEARRNPVLPGNVGVPAFLSGVLAAALAWLSLAAWVYLDARDHGSAAAPGWALLGVLAGPVALAVWLISRRAQGQEAAVSAGPVCPGCGADTPRDAAFCVRCGYALRPSCPECRRLVETDWSYCAACGRDLTE